MLDLKVNFKKKYKHDLNCPFCSVESEHFNLIFICLHLCTKINSFNKDYGARLKIHIQ